MRGCLSAALCATLGVTLCAALPGCVAQHWLDSAPCTAEDLRSDAADVGLVNDRWRTDGRCRRAGRRQGCWQNPPALWLQQVICLAASSSRG